MRQCRFIERPVPWEREIAVAEAAVVLFEQARTKRELAIHARRLAKVGLPPDISAHLQQYAHELDAVAADFEQQARNAAAVAAKSAELAGRAAKLQRDLGDTIAAAIALAGRSRASGRRKPGTEEHDAE
jgi:hypothetical protein